MKEEAKASESGDEEMQNENKGSENALAFTFTGLIALAMSVGCASGEADGGKGSTFTDSGITTLSGSGSETYSPDETGGGSGTPDMSQETEDGGTETGNENIFEGGCEGVDLLFVIDNSSSMAEEQGALVSSIGFIAEALGDVEGVEEGLQVMVVDTDDKWACEGNCAGAAASCEVEGQNLCDPNNMYLEECDLTLGAGVVNTPFVEGECLSVGSRRYIPDYTSPDLYPELFGCTARVGTNGSDDEAQTGAMLSALTDQAEGCNAGFRRDNALLVIVLVTDEDDIGATPSRANQIIGAAGGENNVVLVTLTNGQFCPPDAQEQPHIEAFSAPFKHHVPGTLCVEDFSSFFFEGLGVFDTACEQYVPIG